MPPQKRPRGEMWPIDEDWKRAVIKRMDELAMSRATLARDLNVAPSAITQLLSMAQAAPRQSRLVPRIHKALGLVKTTKPADAIERDDAYRRLMSAWPELTEAQRLKIVELTELFTTK